MLNVSFLFIFSKIVNNFSQLTVSPKVTTHHRIVNSGQGYDADLRCVFLSNPQGSAIWKKNGTRVYGNQKYVYSYDSHNNHNRTTLTVKSVERSDLTDYECEVTVSIW